VSVKSLPGLFSRYIPSLWDREFLLVAKDRGRMGDLFEIYFIFLVEIYVEKLPP
jgi:hypothetical protein